MSKDLWPGMTKKQHRLLGQYIGRLADVLMLCNWTLKLSDAPCEEQALAHVDPIEGRHYAIISVCRDWFELSLDVRRHSIIHELLHLWHNEQTDVIRCGVNQSGMARPAYDVLWETFRLATERMVDDMAVLLGKYADDQNFIHFLEGREHQ